MKKMTVLAALILAFVCLNACGKKATIEEPAAPEVIVAVEEPAVDPALALAQQKYADGLKKFNNEDYKGALKVWEDCVKQYPAYSYDCATGANAARNMIDQLNAAHK
jgi:outer membrane protein assembly factor BamD (BamD/ComL family)